MNTLSARYVERRIFLSGGALVLAGSIVTWAGFGFARGLAFLVGGILAALNLAWIRQTVHAILREDPKLSKRSVLGGFILRLLLIPLCLYVMIRFLFWSISAAVAGFALFYCSVFFEGILEALGRNARNERTE